MKRSDDRVVRSMLRESYLVTTVDEEGFEGVLYDADPLSLVFVRAVAVGVNSDSGQETRMPIDGLLLIPRTRIKYLQTTRL